MKYLILYGNIADGMWFEGPYDSITEANRCGDESHPFIVEFLHRPGTGDGFPDLPLSKFGQVSAEILLSAAEHFPGLLNSEEEVNGGDLVEFLSGKLSDIHSLVKS